MITLQKDHVYVENNVGVFRRVEVCAEIDGKFIVVDLSEETTRKAVSAANSIQEIYRSEFAREYI